MWPNDIALTEDDGVISYADDTMTVFQGALGKADERSETVDGFQFAQFWHWQNKTIKVSTLRIPKEKDSWSRVFKVQTLELFKNCTYN